jgi:hypothetical protein
MRGSPQPKEENVLPKRSQPSSIWKQLEPHQRKQIAQCIARLIQQVQKQLNEGE